MQIYAEFLLKEIQIFYIFQIVLMRKNYYNRKQKPIKPLLKDLDATHPTYFAAKNHS